MATIGLEYTPADKNMQDIKEWKTIREVQFLKRTFRFEPLLGRNVAPLELQTSL